MVDGTAVNMLTVDVEDYFHVAAFENSISRSEWTHLPSRVEGNSERILDIFNTRGVKATFFILGWVAERFPQLVARISDAGHEIASHGYSHSLIYRQDRQTFREETQRAKALLEDASGKEVLGYRAASWSITHDSWWALDILRESGFAYDSSIYPVRRDLYGIPDGQRFVHDISLPSGSLVEIPPTTVELAGRKLPVGGGGYFRLYPYSFTKWALQRVNQRNGKPFVFYLHPWEIDPGQPRVNANWKSRFRHYVNIGSCEEKLRRLLADFRFTTISNSLIQQGRNLTALEETGTDDFNEQPEGCPSWQSARGTTGK